MLSSPPRAAHRDPRRLLVGALACVGLLACGSMIDPGDAGACQQTYEFGNSGCLEVTGQVVGPDGQPLAGIVVGPRYLPGSDVFSGGHSTTDAAGAFSFRIWRMADFSPATGPDTLSLWVHGADPRSAGLGIPATVRDSVLVQATVSPIGTIPTPTTVRLTLSAP